MESENSNRDFVTRMTFSKSRVPLIGALIDYVSINLLYLRKKTLSEAEKLRAKTSPATLSASFCAYVCLLLGLASNVKFEVVMLNEEPLTRDLHLMIMSKSDQLYIDDVNPSKVLWCFEASDCLVVLISCLLIWNSSRVRSPLSEYLFLPWLGATLRGLIFRQAPTAGALLYTMAMINGNVNPLFTTSFSFLFLLEARLWLEIARLVRSRWELHNYNAASLVDEPQDIETLWRNDDVHSVERSPLSEYLFLPWLGATLRGLIFRQAPTAGALLYTMAMINGNANPLFTTSFSFLFLLEARLWLEIARLVRSRWELHNYNAASLVDEPQDIETLWRNDDVHSVEVSNTVY